MDSQTPSFRTWGWGPSRSPASERHPGWHPSFSPKHLKPGSHHGTHENLEQSKCTKGQRNLSICAQICQYPGEHSAWTKSGCRRRTLVRVCPSLTDGPDAVPSRGHFSSEVRLAPPLGKVPGPGSPTPQEGPRDSVLLHLDGLARSPLRENTAFNTRTYTDPTADARAARYQPTPPPCRPGSSTKTTPPRTWCPEDRHTINGHDPGSPVRGSGRSGAAVPRSPTPHRTGPTLCRPPQEAAPPPTQESHVPASSRADSTIYPVKHQFCSVPTPSDKLRRKGQSRPWAWGRLQGSCLSPHDPSGKQVLALPVTLNR